MANYMLSNYVIEGDKTELDEFEAMLRRLEAMEEKDFPIKDISWGSKWLGFVVNELGEDYTEFNCKGCWNNLKRRSDGVMSIDMDSAWWPPEDLIELIADKWNSFQFYFYREELGSGVFQTNDVDGKYFPQRYHLFSYVPIKGEKEKEEFVEFEEYLNSEDEVIAFVNDTLHHSVTSLADIESWDNELQTLNEEKEDDEDWEECFIYVNEIDVL